MSVDNVKEAPVLTEPMPVITSKHWGPGKNPDVDPPDEVHNNSTFSINVVDPMASVVAAEVLKKGGTMEEAYKAATDHYQKKLHDDKYGPGQASVVTEKKCDKRNERGCHKKEIEVPVESEEDKQNKAALLRRYLQTIMRLNGLAYKEMEVWEMLDLINTGGLKIPCTFEQWVANVAETERLMMGD